MTEQAAAPVVAELTGVLAAADVVTVGSALAVFESMWPELGSASRSTPETPDKEDPATGTDGRGRAS